jgi:hypothetical protein
MAITKLSNSGIATGGVLKYDSMLAGNPAYSPTSFESIATSTITSPVAFVEFLAIPATFKNLQIRFVAKTASGSVGSSATKIEYNGDTTAGNYFSNYFIAIGSATYYANYANNANYGTWVANGGGMSANGFGYGVVDIYDYTNTNKFTSSLNNSGLADDTYQQFHQSAATWKNTALVTNFRITALDGNFVTGSIFSLYGTKG